MLPCATARALVVERFQRWFCRMRTCTTFSRVVGRVATLARGACVDRGPSQFFPIIVCHIVFTSQMKVDS